MNTQDNKYIKLIYESYYEGTLEKDVSELTEEDITDELLEAVVYLKYQKYMLNESEESQNDLEEINKILEEGLGRWIRDSKLGAAARRVGRALKRTTQNIGTAISGLDKSEKQKIYNQRSEADAKRYALDQKAILDNKELKEKKKFNKSDYKKEMLAAKRNHDITGRVDAIKKYNDLKQADADKRVKLNQQHDDIRLGSKNINSVNKDYATQFGKKLPKDEAKVEKSEPASKNDDTNNQSNTTIANASWEYYKDEFNQLLESNGYEVSEENILTLSESILNNNTIILSSDDLVLTETMDSDYIFMQILDNNGFIVNENNLNVIREAYENGSVLFEDSKEEKPSMTFTEKNKNKRAKWAKAAKIAAGVLGGMAIGGALSAGVGGGIGNAIDDGASKAHDIDVETATKTFGETEKSLTDAEKAVEDAKAYKEKLSLDKGASKEDFVLADKKVEEAEKAYNTAKTNHDGSIKEKERLSKFDHRAHQKKGKAIAGSLGAVAGGAAGGVVADKVSKAKDDEDNENEKREDEVIKGENRVFKAEKKLNKEKEENAAERVKNKEKENRNKADAANNKSVAELNNRLTELNKELSDPNLPEDKKKKIKSEIKSIGTEINQKQHLPESYNISYMKNKMHLLDLLEANGYEPSNENLNILVEEIVNKETIILSYTNSCLNEDADPNYFFTKILDNNGFIVNENNLSVLKEAFKNGHVMLDKEEDKANDEDEKKNKTQKELKQSQSKDHFGQVDKGRIGTALGEPLAREFGNNLAKASTALITGTLLGGGIDKMIK